MGGQNRLEWNRQLSQELRLTSPTGGLSYNLAKYDTQWLAQTPEAATTSYFDLRGQQVTGVPKLTVILWREPRAWLWRQRSRVGSLAAGAQPVRCRLFPEQEHMVLPLSLIHI